MGYLNPLASTLVELKLFYWYGLLTTGLCNMPYDGRGRWDPNGMFDKGGRPLRRLRGQKENPVTIFALVFIAAIVAILGALIRHH